MGDPRDNEASTQDQISQAQLDKLKLEIASLRKKNKWETGLQVVPLFTTLIAIVGFFFGFYQFQRQQERERVTREADLKLKLQSQWRADGDAIFGFPQDPKETISKVSFLFEDLKNILASQVNDKENMSDVFPSYKQQFTRSLVKLIIRDSDFNTNPRDVTLAATALEHWEDYASYLKENLGELRPILYKHVRALRYLKDKNPAYFQKITYDAANQYHVPPEFEKQEGEEKLYQHFLGITNGFKAHLALLKDDARPEAAKIQEQYERNFQSALCRPAISVKILGHFYQDEPPCDK
jgi:hypothetical protein